MPSEAATAPAVIPTSVVPAPVAMPPAAATPVSAVQPRDAAPIVMRKSIEVLLAERQSMLSAAGLALVETDAAKWRAAYDRAAQYVEPPRVPRAKRPAPVIDQGPLILVETRKN